MRIYNATNSQLNLPFPGSNVSIAPHSVSGNLGANTQTISMLVSAYNTSEIAFIVSGPFELNLCSSIPTVVSYVVQSLEEAIEKLEPKTEKKEVVVEKEKEEAVKKDAKAKPAKKEVKKEVEVVEEPKIEKVEEDTVITIAESKEPAAEPYEEAECGDYCDKKRDEPESEEEEKDFYDDEDEDPASELQ